MLCCKQLYGAGIAFLKRILPNHSWANSDLCSVERAQEARASLRATLLLEWARIPRGEPQTQQQVPWQDSWVKRCVSDLLPIEDACGPAPGLNKLSCLSEWACAQQGFWFLKRMFDWSFCLSIKWSIRCRGWWFANRFFFKYIFIIFFIYLWWPTIYRQNLQISTTALH